MLGKKIKKMEFKSFNEPINVIKCPFDSNFRKHF